MTINYNCALPSTPHRAGPGVDSQSGPGGGLGLGGGLVWAQSLDQRVDRDRGWTWGVTRLDVQELTTRHIKTGWL
uniref:Uncharacterized protein n=1 Tax=Knipowitschia caucasica TaxID=637954 RepID=A0AAV2KG54_KNICA